MLSDRSVLSTLCCGSSSSQWSNQENIPVTIDWNSHAIEALDRLKQMLVTKPVLKHPDVTQGFILRTDAVYTGLGAALLQHVEGVLSPIAYASKKLLPSQHRYSVYERECLAIVWAVDKFKVYLFSKAFILQTAHRALVFLNSANHTNDRIMHWTMLLQP